MSRTRPLETTPLSIVRALISSSMASVPLILQHNWTGVLAIYATAPAQPLLANPVKGVSNSRARGAWLKATSHARLRMHESQDAGCCIELYLQEHVLLRCPLHKQLLSMNLLPSSSTGSSNILLITPNQQSKERTAAPICYCLRFFDDSDCTSFKSALEVMKSNRHKKLLQMQAQQLAAQQQQQQQQPAEATAAGGAGPATGEVFAGAAVTAAMPQPRDVSQGPILQRGERVAGMSQAQVKDVIKHYLLDPAFHSYVDEVEAMWDEVEQEILGHMEGQEDGTASMQM